MIGKTLVTLALTAGIVGGTAGIASAHECVIANRSEQGDTGATHSKSWERVELAELYAHAHHFLAGPGGELPALSAEQIQQAVAEAAKLGVPMSFVTFKQMIPGYLNALSGPEAMAPSPKSVDGKGVDHFFSAYGADIVGIYFQIAFGASTP